MTPLQISGTVLLAVSAAVGAAAVVSLARRRRAAKRARFETAGVLGDLAADSLRAEGEFEEALAGLQAAEGTGLADWLARLVRSGSQHRQRLDAVHARLDRLAAAERHLAETAVEVAAQRDRVDVLCRTAEAADPSQPALAVAAVTAVVSDVLDHEREMRAEVADAKTRLEGRADRLAGAERDRYRDPVTQLPNRRAFRERAAAVAGRAPATPFAVLSLAVEDLDGLAARSGHAARDAVMAVAGRVVKESARSTDFVARVGADEFAVLLFSADPRAAATVADACRRAAAVSAVRLPGGDLSFSLAAGLALPTPGVSGEALLDQAREARDRGRTPKAAAVGVA